MLFPVKATVLSKLAARFSSRLSDRVPNGFDILLLALAWGNLGYAAGPSYLRHVAGHVVRSNGAILECGSGATTVLTAMLCQGTGRQFIVLEHNRIWHDYLRRILDYLNFSHVTLIRAPLIDYEGYRWYRLPQDLVIEKIGLVVCDGPPSSNPGGRYGLLPTMIDHLDDDCVILMDDTHRRAEQHILNAWTECRCMRANRIGRFGTYAEVVFC
ncbi:MAG: hypothetical protein ABW098_15210 [Candidatus Thiodiazotropha sp.]